MSGVGTQPPTPPPSPLGLPPPQRGLRSLNILPAVIAGMILVSAIGLVLWTIFSVSDGPGATADAGTGTAQGADAADILAHAPQGNEVVAFQLPGSDHVIVPSPRAPPVAAPAEDVPVDMTEAAIAARKAAWAAYYAASAKIAQDRSDRAQASMVADTEVDNKTDALPAAPSTQSADKKATGDPYAIGPSSPATDYAPYTLTDPISRYEVEATDQVTAKLVTQLNSDSAGLLKALVTKPVLDHATGMHILIPQGATLEGYYHTDVSYGQTRVTTAWTRIHYPPPCDQSLDLGSMPGADQTGQAGFEDLTDNHLCKVFTSAILVSIFSAGSQLSQPQQSAFSSYSPYQSAAGAVGQQTSQLGTEFARKGLSIAPTERVRAGYNFSVFLTRDIAFAQPWVSGVCGPMQVAAS